MVEVNLLPSLRDFEALTVPVGLSVEERSMKIIKLYRWTKHGIGEIVYFCSSKYNWFTSEE